MIQVMSWQKLFLRYFALFTSRDLQNISVLFESTIYQSVHLNILCGLPSWKCVMSWVLFRSLTLMHNDSQWPGLCGSQNLIILRYSSLEVVAFQGLRITNPILLWNINFIWAVSTSTKGALFLKVMYLRQTVISLVAMNLLVIAVGDLIQLVQIFLGLKVTMLTDLSSLKFSPHTCTNKPNDKASLNANFVRLTLMT